MFNFLSNWKVRFMSLLVNMVAIAITALVLPGLTITDLRLITFVLLAIVLGLLNTLIKPIFQLLTIRLVFITYGINLVIINTIMLLLLDRIFANALHIDSFLAAIVGATLIWAISTFLDYVFGVLPPLGYMQALRDEESK